VAIAVAPVIDPDAGVALEHGRQGVGIVHRVTRVGVHDVLKVALQRVAAIDRGQAQQDALDDLGIGGLAGEGVGQAQLFRQRQRPDQLHGADVAAEGHVDRLAHKALGALAQPPVGGLVLGAGDVKGVAQPQPGELQRAVLRIVGVRENRAAIRAGEPIRFPPIPLPKVAVDPLRGFVADAVRAKVAARVPGAHLGDKVVKEVGGERGDLGGQRQGVVQVATSRLVPPRVAPQRLQLLLADQQARLQRALSGVARLPGLALATALRLLRRGVRDHLAPRLIAHPAAKDGHLLGGQLVHRLVRQRDQRPGLWRHHLSPVVWSVTWRRPMAPSQLRRSAGASTGVPVKATSSTRRAPAGAAGA